MLKVALLCLVYCLIAGARPSHLHYRRADSDSSLSSDTSTTSLPPLSVPPPPLPSVTPSSYLLYFSAFPQVTTCQPATFTWTYFGPSSQLANISIIYDNSASSTTSEDSSSITSTSTSTSIRSIGSRSSTSNTINFVVANNIDPSRRGFTWTAVAVPGGWYKLHAVIPAENFSIDSTDFYVQPGDDNSCLSNSNSSASVQSRASSRSVGAIIGGVLGGAAFILAAAIILLLYRRNRLVKPRSKMIPTRGVYPDDDRKWTRGGASHPLSGPSGSWDHLGSVDSQGTTAKNINHQPYGSFADSVHLPVLDYTHARSPSNGDGELGGSPASLSKSPFEDAAALETSLSVDAQHSVHRRRRLSDASSLVASTALSHLSGAAAEVELASSPNFATRNPTPKASKSRKATRKPVPSYDPSAVPASISSSRTSASPLSEAIEPGMLDAGDPFARPEPAVIHKGSASSLDILAGFNAAVAGGSAHYVSRTHSLGGKDRDRELNHKSSFGGGGLEGRPMHYLMPDMPMPQK